MASRPPSRCALILATLSALAFAAPAQAAPPGPPLTAPPGALERMTDCDALSARPRATPVVLVAGTAANNATTWDYGYRRVLPQRGFPTCTVELPDLGYGDAQVASEYVVHALRQAVARAGGAKLAVIGHSQAALEIWWALRFWPDLPAKVGEIVTLAGAWNGSTQADFICASPFGCFPAAWQLKPSSRFIAALKREPLPAGPDYTSIITRNDEVVTPQPQASHIDRGRNAILQDLCPGRPTEHALLPGDAVAFAIAVDALTHDGPADPARVDRSVCNQVALPGADVAAFVAGAALFVANLAAGALHSPARAEPRLRCYADPACRKRAVAGSAPAVARDGSAIAFVRDGDVFVAAGDGSAARRLVRTRGADDDPSFSADGGRLVWGRATSSGCDVLTANADGSALRRVTTSRDRRCHPAFAPDGRVVFADAGDILSVRADGGGRRRLTRTRVREGEPAVSVGGIVAFARIEPGGVRRHIYTLAPGATRPRRLTGGRQLDGEPAFSADGRRVVFTRRTSGGRALRTARIGGAGSRRVASPRGRVSNPVYYPDGAVLFAYRSSARARSVLWRTSPRGRAAALATP